MAMTKADLRLQCIFRLLTVLSFGGVILIICWEFIKEVFK